MMFYSNFFKKKSYVFFGETHSPNLGDSVICNVAKVIIENTFGIQDVYIQDVSYILRSNDANLQKIRLLCQRIHIDSKRFEKWYYTAILSINIPRNSNICYVGGALFQDFFINQILLVLKIARIKNCSFATISLGIGLLSSNNICRLRNGLKCIKKVDLSLRDGIEFFKLQVDKRAYWSPDIAIMTKYVYGNKPRNNNTIGIGCIDMCYYNRNFPNKPVSTEEYQNKMIYLVKDLLRNGFSVELFCNGDYQDYITAEKIYNKVNDSKCALRPRPQNDKELVDIISSYLCIISARLHSLIISYSYDIPFIGIEWDNKVKAFADTLNLGMFVFKMNDICEINSDMVKKRLQIGFNSQIRKQQEECIIERIKKILG